MHQFAMNEGSLFSASSPALVLLLIIAILTLCGFDYRALLISDVKLFSWPSVCPLQRNVCSSPLPFFYQVVFFILSCMSSLYILDLNPLSDVSFCRYLLPFSRVPFCFVDCFLCSSKAFLVWCSPIWFFSFGFFLGGRCFFFSFRFPYLRRHIQKKC